MKLLSRETARDNQRQTCLRRPAHRPCVNYSNVAIKRVGAAGRPEVDTNGLGSSADADQAIQLCKPNQFVPLVDQLDQHRAEQVVVSPRICRRRTQQSGPPPHTPKSTNLARRLGIGGIATMRPLNRVCEATPSCYKVLK